MQVLPPSRWQPAPLYVHASAGELSTSLKPSPSRYSKAIMQSTAFQKNASQVTGLATVAAPTPSKGFLLQRPLEPDTTQCLSILGARTFKLLREVMLSQQDTFLEQLWELHRVARVQGRKQMMATLLDAAGDRDSSLTGPDIFNRSRQVEIHAETMQSIVTLPTLPKSLRLASGQKRKRSGSENCKLSKVGGSGHVEPATKVHTASANEVAAVLASVPPTVDMATIGVRQMRSTCPSISSLRGQARATGIDGYSGQQGVPSCCFIVTHRTF
jgi:hypothetical protein